MQRILEHRGAEIRAEYILEHRFLLLGRGTPKSKENDRKKKKTEERDAAMTANMPASISLCSLLAHDTALSRDSQYGGGHGKGRR